MSQKNKEKYVHLTYSILGRKDLSDKDKIVYCFIQGFWSGMCKASDEYIGKIMGCSSRSIARSIRDLKEKKLIWSNPRYKDGKVIGRTLTVIKKKNDQTGQGSNQESEWI